MAGAGGAWKVAYADFVTAMMAFFLVMWIVAQNKPAVKEAIAGYFRDPTGSGLTPGGQGFLEGGAPRTKADVDLKRKGAAGGRSPTLAVIQNSKGTSVGASILFSDDQSQLDDAARERIKDILPLLIGKKTKIELRAHVIRQSQDDQQDQVKAWQMCYERCLVVMKELQALGIDADRFRLSQAGPYEPHVTAQDPLWRKRNSRVEVIMLNEYVDDYDKNRKQAEQGDKSHGDDDDAQHGEEHDAGHDKASPAVDTHGAGKHGDSAHGKAAAPAKSDGHGKAEKAGAH